MNRWIDGWMDEMRCTQQETYIRHLSSLAMWEMQIKTMMSPVTFRKSNPDSIKSAPDNKQWQLQHTTSKQATVLAMCCFLIKLQAHVIYGQPVHAKVKKLCLSLDP